MPQLSAKDIVTTIDSIVETKQGNALINTG